MGRKSIYTREIADDICARLAGGEGLATICRNDGYPCEGTVRGWVIDDVDGISARYARAREIQADVLAEQIVAISDEQSEVTRENGEKYDPDVNRDRLRIDARKWYASKVAPKKYGEKIEVDAKIEARDVSVETLDAAIAKQLAKINASE
jgi:hypothetical protein